MMLLDTNILGRIAQPGSLHYQPAVDAVAWLHNKGETLVICAQNIIEFYAIATRAGNSLQMTPEEALAEIAAIKARFALLPDVPLHASWERLIAKYRVANKLVFDLRLVAAGLVGGCQTILTFNDRDFARFSEISPLNPFDLLQIPRV